MNIQFNILVEKDKDGYLVRCPELKELQLRGTNLDEVIRRMGESIQDHIKRLSNEQLSPSQASQEPSEI